MANEIEKKTRKSVVAVNESAKSIETELVRFSTGNKSIDFNIDPSAETVWATQQQIADAFDVSRSTVAEHIRNIFKDNELDEDTCCRKFRQVLPDGRAYEPPWSIGFMLLYVVSND